MNQLEIEAILDRLLQKAESELEKVFNKRLREILFQVSEMYRKYEKDGELSWTEVNKYNRFQKEMKLIADALTSDYRYIAKELQSSMEAQYIEGYLLSAYLLEKATDRNMGFSIPSLTLVKEVLLNPIEYLTLTKVLEEHRNEIVRKLNIEIATSIQAGEGYSKMAKRIRQAVGFSKVKSMRVARTEGSRTRSLMNDKVLEQASKYVDIKKRWLSSLDLKVRKTHRKLDGKDANKEGYFTYGPNKAKGPSLWVGPQQASLSINCRCVVISIVDGMIPEYRRGRDYMDADYQRKLAERIDQYMEDGDTYKEALKKARKEISPPSVVRPYETYEDWLKRQKTS